MNIIRNSDIAQLVLGYLRDQNLELAANSFCKTSPYLKEEYRLLKKGLRTMSLGSGTLVDIIKEHCQIKSKISQMIDTLPAENRERILKQNTLVEKISCIIKMIGKEKLTEKKEKFTRNNRKRARSYDSLDNLETTKVQDLPGFEIKTNLAKRYRKSASYFFLGNSTMVDDYVTDEEEEEEEEVEEQELSADGSEKSRNSSSLFETDTNEGEGISAVTENETENQLESKLCPDNSITVPALSDTILRKTEFQNILVENINKALQTSVQINTTINNNLEESPEKNSQQNDVDICDQSILTAQLDEMIKKILDETEKDPTFDEIIKEAINLTNSTKKSVSGKSDLQTPPRTRSEKPLSQCQSNKDCISQKYESALLTTNKSTQVSRCKELNFPQNCTEPTTTLKVQPTLASLSEKTVLISSSSENESPSVVSIEPNIPQKFILLNANETLATFGGGDTAFLSCANLNNIQTFNSNDQVLFDFNSGQLSIPLIATNDNVAFPVILNNEIIKQLPLPPPPPQQQQQQNENSQQVNLENEKNDSSHVEFSKDIRQSETTISHPQSVVSDQQAEINLNDNASKSATNPPNADLENTPQNSIIQPSKERSLSTPRRRMSHVRVLNFGATEQAREQNHDVPSKILNSNVNSDQDLQLTNTVSQSNDNRIENEAMANVEINQNKDKFNEEIPDSNKTLLKSKENKQNQSKDEKIKKKKLKKKKTAENKKKYVSPSTKKYKTLQKTSEDESSKPTSKLETKNNNKEEEIITLEKWNQMRATFSRPNWDQHLRELQAKSSMNSVKSEKSSSKKCFKRRNKTGDKSGSESTKTKDHLNNDQKLNDENKKKNNSENEKSTRISKSSSSSSSVQLSSQKSSVLPKITSSSTNSARKKGFIKFKIPTPVKKVKEIQKVEKIIENSTTSIVKENNTIQVSELKTKCIENVEVIPPIERSNQDRNHDQNISLLLETPYKMDIPQIPITPRFIMLDAQETPITKMMKSIQTQESISKEVLDIETPNFAITPGAGLINNEKETPMSVGGVTYNNRLTDYSSGGSYYKPDESDDLDRHLDRLLMAERKKRQSPLRKVVTETLCIKNSEMVNTSNEEMNISYDGKLLSPNSNAYENQPPFTSAKKRNSTKQVVKILSNIDVNNRCTPKSNLSMSDVSSKEDEDDWVPETPHHKVTLKTIERNLMTVKKNVPCSTKKCIKIIESDRDKRERQLRELEAKRLRIKAKLKTDFNTKRKEIATRMTTRKLSALKERAVINASRKLVKKSSTSIRVSELSKKPPIIVRTPSAKVAINLPVPTISRSCAAVDDIYKNETDVLKALNLSAKKQSNSEKVLLTKENKKEFDSAIATAKKVVETHNINDNATTGDSFENDAIRIRLAAEYDSHDSGESAQVRNAALVLAEFQKNSNLKVDKSQNEIKHDQSENDTRTEKNRIFLKPAATSTNSLKNSEAREKTILRSPRLRGLSKKTYQTREVKILPKCESLLAESSKLFSKNSQNQTRTIRTRSFKKLEGKLESNRANEINALQKMKSLSLTSSNTKLKKDTRKQSKTTEKTKTELNYKIKSPIAVKQTKVVLEMITEDQLSAIPVRQQTYENKEKNISSNKSNKEEVFSPSEKKPKEEELKSECDTVRSDDENVNKLKTVSVTKVDDRVHRQAGVVETVECLPHHELQENLKTSENEKLNESHTTNNDDLLDDNKDDDEDEEEDDDNDDSDDDEDEDDDDPYDECKIETIDENDKARFIKITHSDDDESKPSQLATNAQKTITEDFDKNILNMKMKIFLNNVLHSIEVTDEIELFSKQNDNETRKENEKMIVSSSVPYSRRKIIKNIPKKREKTAHILHYSDGNVSPGLEQKHTQTIVQSSPMKNPTTPVAAVAENDHDISNVDNVADCSNNQQNSSAEMIERIPKYTSTPCKPKFRIHFKDRSIKTTKKLCRRNIVVAKKKINRKTAHLIIRQMKNNERNEKFESSSKKSFSPISEEQAKILRQEDIYAVLSHLHGTDDVKT